ncbi:MAG: hypothetical protein Q8P30_02000, partial [Candidatus Uhrbacteria bacterium]|nr:hypothetical protein [Candidatus Uhrbacteria bacterium]
SSAVSPSITATYLTLGGTLLCNNTNAPSLTGFDFSGTSSFAISSGAIVDILTTGANTDLTIGNNPTWSNVNLTFAPSGLLTMDDYISLVLTGNSTINGNAQWSNLVNLTIDSGSTLGSDSRGCASPNDYNNGYGPNGFNVCAISTAGYGRGLNNTGGAQGAGYGGAGGLGTSTNLNTGGLTYGSDTDPILFGSSGGGTGGGGSGGAGGGVIRLNISGTLTNNGLISANGGAGGTNGTNRSGGGGSGGSINITVGTYACDTGSLSVAGGAGGNGTTYDGGGGGGGRLKIIATTDSSTGCTIASLSAATVAAGGLGPDTAVDGSVGTLYTGSSNNPPTVDSVRVSYSANGTNVSPLVPSLGTVKSFHVNGVVSDTDGFADIQNVATVFYRSGATGGVACSSDKNDCYSIASCTLSGGSSNSINYDCDVSADYFIDPTDSGAYSAQTWNVRVSVSDATSTVDDDSYTNEVQTTTGIGAPDTIDFTNLALGATSPTSISYEVTNYGNSAVDTNVSMENPQTCTIGTIPINKIKYGRTDTDYASLEYILSATPSATNLSLPQQTNDVTAVTDMLYWKLQAPAEAVGGTCSGTININAIAG